MKKLEECGLSGLTLRMLTRENAPAIMAIQNVMLAHLPDPSWYYPSPQEMFADCCERGEAWGFFEEEALAGFAVLTPWHVRGDSCYAAKVGEPREDTFDFQDVMVHPQYRRRGIHSAFLRLFEQLARERSGRCLYATVAPGNEPSARNFERAGYECVREQPAYDGRMRRYYRRQL